MKILAIDTSCDETSVAVTEGRKILSNERYSQVLIHEKWGGVVPNLSKRAHEEHIDIVVDKALSKGKVRIEDVDYIAVTYGPGLAIALGVGINKAKDLARKHSKKMIPVNHMEGHIYSCFVQNSKGNPVKEFQFPYLVLLVSGGHTEMVIFSDNVKYQVIGRTRDDAVGEALDKAARLILDDSVYPGGPVIERLAVSGNPEAFDFPRPMIHSKNFDFSFSGLKTALLYKVRDMSQETRLQRMNDLAASYQKACFDSLIEKLQNAMKKYDIYNIAVGGGVAANIELRRLVRKKVRKVGGSVLFPPYKSLNGDNAAMIGVAAYYKAIKGNFVKDLGSFDRDARAEL